MFDWASDYGWRDRLIHFFLCNNPIFQGCSGHKAKDETLNGDDRYTDEDYRVAEEEDRFAAAPGLFTEAEADEALAVLGMDPDGNQRRTHYVRVQQAEYSYETLELYVSLSDGEAMALAKWLDQPEILQEAVVDVIQVEHVGLAATMDTIQEFSGDNLEPPLP